ncbi:MAG: hypothetical protein CM1200mP2_01830 [Planctomycetaceae bacterium]|nr:MAG: hypothetical protein CM1200mP2_01830 [Planctomycetaceae bacterium]
MPWGPGHKTVTRSLKWQPKQTAVIVCDMWDLHHCLNAHVVVPKWPEDEQSPEAGPAQRRKDHPRSQQLMNTYKDHPGPQTGPGRTPLQVLPDEISKWCYKIPSEEKGSTRWTRPTAARTTTWRTPRVGQEARKMGRNPRAPWKSQTDTLEIDNRITFRTTAKRSGASWRRRA